MLLSLVVDSPGLTPLWPTLGEVYAVIVVILLLIAIGFLAGAAWAGSRRTEANEVYETIENYLAQRRREMDADDAAQEGILGGVWVRERIRGARTELDILERDLGMRA